MGFSTQAAGTLALSSQIGGGVTSAIGAYAGAQASRAQADISDTNARLSELGAQAALLQGQSQEQQALLQTAELKSRQRATLAANGVDLGEGTAARALTSTDVLGAVDAATVHANAVRAAFGYRTQALSYTNDAMLRRAGSNGLVAAGTTLLGSTGQVASSWYQMSKAGVFTSQPKPTVTYGTPQTGP